MDTSDAKAFGDCLEFHPTTTMSEEEVSTARETCQDQPRSTSLTTHPTQLVSGRWQNVSLCGNKYSPLGETNTNLSGQYVYFLAGLARHFLEFEPPAVRKSRGS
jgi:hypothetical protein